MTSLTTMSDREMLADSAVSRMKRADILARFQASSGLAHAVALDDQPLRPGAADAPIRPAAVLVPIVDRPQGLTILLTVRAAHLSHHAGQISFPGGRIEPSDADEEAAALRETFEEIGLEAQHIEVLGRLDRFETRTRFDIVPVVGLITPPFSLTLEPAEVAEIFEVPLAFVLDPDNHRLAERVIEGKARRHYEIPFSQRVIWGATAAILRNLADRLIP